MRTWYLRAPDNDTKVLMLIQDEHDNWWFEVPLRGISGITIPTTKEKARDFAHLLYNDLSK